MNCFGRMWASFKNRKRYNSLKECPTVTLFIGMILCSVAAAGSLHVLNDVRPAYLEAFNRVHGWSDFGIAGVASTIVMLILFIHVWFFGGLANGCRRVLNDRLFR